VDRYRFSKLGEQTTAGRRTIVSTKAREFFGLDPIYKGVPYADRVGYAKALKALQKRLGLSAGEARETLRYYQPKAFLSEAKGQTLLMYGEQYKQPILVTTGERITRPDVRILEESLGIRTRAGRSTIEFIKARGQQIKQKGEKISVKEGFIESPELIAEDVLVVDQAFGIKTQSGRSILEFIRRRGIRIGETKSKDVGEVGIFQAPEETTLYRSTIDVEKAFLTKEGYPYTPIRSVGKMTKEFEKLSGAIKEGKVQRGDFGIEYYDEGDLIREARSAKDFAASKSDLFAFLDKRKVPTIFIDEGEIVGIKARESVTRQVAKQRAKKPPLEKEDDFARVLDNLEKTYEKTPKAAKIPSDKTAQNVRLKVEEQELRSLQLPPEQATITRVKQIKDIASTASQKSKVVQVSSVILAQRSQQRLRTAQQMEESQLRTEPAVVIESAIRLRQAQMQVQQTRQVQKPIVQITDFGKITSTPLPIVTTAPPYRTPSLPPFIYEDLKIMLRKKKKKKEKGFEQAFLVPDFASRILGITPQEVGSEKEALKEINRIQTGLELRRGLRVRA